jgi:hypothetical protein
MVKSKYLLTVAILFGTAGASEVARTAVGHPVGKARRGRPRGTDSSPQRQQEQLDINKVPGGLPAAVVRVRQVGSGSVTGSGSGLARKAKW